MQCGRPRFDSWVGEIPWRKGTLHTPVNLGFPGGSDDKESACDVGDMGSIPGLGRHPGEGNSYLLQYSCLENSKDRGAWGVPVPGVAKSQTWLSHFHLCQLYLQNTGKLFYNYLWIDMGIIFEGVGRNQAKNIWDHVMKHIDGMMSIPNLFLISRLQQGCPMPLLLIWLYTWKQFLAIYIITLV